MDIYRFLKIYPHFSRLYSYSVGFDDLVWFAPEGKKANNRRMSTITTTEDDVLRSVRRSKTILSDIVLCNTFSQFATFTFNGSKDSARKFGYTITNREDINECKEKMRKWLKNQRDIHGGFDYLIVPEYHKDGKAIHFHALMHGYNGHLKYSGRKRNQRMIYNIKSYKLGHSTVVKIPQTHEDYSRVASYIKKYMTKDMPLFKGKNRYWCSKGLKRPERVSNPQLTPFDLQTFEPVYTKGKLTIHRSDLVSFSKVIKNHNAIELTKFFTPDIIQMPVQLNL